jgi:hypothetical protein
MGAIGHIIGTLFRAIVKIFFVGLICGIIGAGVTLLLVYSSSGKWPPTLLGEIAAIAVGILSLYAGGITVLMIEAVKALKEAAKGVEKEAGSALKDGGSIVQTIEKHL